MASGGCVAAGCRGVVVADGACLGHADAQTRDKILADLSRGRRLDVLRGVTVSPELLGRVLAAVPRDPRGRPRLIRPDFTTTVFEAVPRFSKAVFEGYANFTRAWFPRGGRFGAATFTQEACFRRALFGGPARFDGATFRGAANFGDATFDGGARFAGARFAGPATFKEVGFGQEAIFGRAAFDRTASFARANFRDVARFPEVTFGDRSRWRWAVFAFRAELSGSTFHGPAEFGGASFGAGLGLLGARFLTDVEFGRTTWHTRQQIGPFLAAGTAAFDAAVFRERVLLHAVAGRVDFRRARFDGGIRTRLRWADVALTDAEIIGPSLIAGAPVPFAEIDEDDVSELTQTRRVRHAHPRQPWLPRLVDLRGTDVSPVALSHIDVRDCPFRGAHNLDRMRFEGEVVFGRSPAGWRWTARHTLVEEHAWRVRRRRRRHAGWDPGPFADLARQPSAELIAVVYRDLRRGMEEARDEPGAADFYYGEMEMRRFAKADEAGRLWRERRWGASVGAASEYLVLLLYWVVSGYGLRAWRALVGFAVAVLLAAVALTVWGFPPGSANQGFADAMRAALQYSTAVLRDRKDQLTDAGEWIELSLRFAGPGFLGLAIFALRGRVKR